MGRAGEGEGGFRGDFPVSPSSGAAELCVEQLLSSSSATRPGPGVGGEGRGGGAFYRAAHDQMVLVKELPGGGSGLGAPFSAAVRGGEVGEARAVGSERQPGSAGVRRAPSAPLGGGWLLLLEFRNPEAAGVSSPGASAGTGPEPSPSSAFAPPTRELVGIFLQMHFVSLQR